MEPDGGQLGRGAALGARPASNSVSTDNGAKSGLARSARKIRRARKAASAVATPTARRLAFVLGGIGSQWESMGTRLMYFSPTFRNTMGRLTSHLKAVDPHSPAADLVSLFASGTHSWGSKNFSGIGICAYQIGAINVLREAGFQPDYIIGHSLGETASGYCAGLQSERETILIQWVRSRMIRKVRTSHHLLKTTRQIDGLELLFDQGGEPSEEGFFYYYVYDAEDFINSGRLQDGDFLYDLRGQMSVVGLSVGEVEAAIQEMGLGGQVCVACQNSPQGQTLSGPKEQLARLKAYLESKRASSGLHAFFWRDVPTDGVAYHAPFFSCFYGWLVKELEKLGIGGSGQLASGTSSPGEANDSSIEYYVDGKEKRPSSYRLMNEDGTGWLSTSSADPENVVLNASYHARNVVNSVRFTRAVQSLPKTAQLDGKTPASSFSSDGAPISINNVLVVEIGSSRSLLGQVTRTRADLAVLGLVTVGRKDTESIYLDQNNLRLAFWHAGYMGAFGMNCRTPSAINSRMPFERNVAWSLVEKAKITMQREVTPEVYEKEKKTAVEDVVQALQTCIRAAKPRPKLVLFALRRAFCCCARDPTNHIRKLLPFLRAVSVKDGVTEYGQVAGGLVLLFEQNSVEGC